MTKRALGFILADTRHMSPRKSFTQTSGMSFSRVSLCLVWARSVPSVKKERLKIKEPPQGKEPGLPESLNLFLLPTHKCVHVAGLPGLLAGSL